MKCVWLGSSTASPLSTVFGFLYLTLAPCTSSCLEPHTQPQVAMPYGQAILAPRSSPVSLTIRRIGRVRSGFIWIVSPTSFIMPVFIPPVMTQAPTTVESNSSYLSPRPYARPVVLATLRSPRRKAFNMLGFILKSFAPPVSEMTSEGRWITNRSTCESESWSILEQLTSWPHCSFSNCLTLTTEAFAGTRTNSATLDLLSGTEQRSSHR